MRRIRILDNDPSYATTLASFLSRRMRDCEAITGLASPQTKDEADSRADDGIPDDAVVAGEGYLAWHPEDTRLPVLRLSPLPAYADGLGDDSAHEFRRISRLGDARAIAETLERALDSPSDPHMPPVRPDAGLVVAGVIGDVCDRVRKSHVARLTAQAQKKGGRAAYLPCLPGSRASVLPLSVRGPDTLTQLLLLAGAGDPCDDAMGPSLHPSRSGVLCVRPAESHEHLLECGPAAMRTVVSALVRWVENQPIGSIAVVDLSELPEHAAAAVLSVCTECHLLMEQSAGERSDPSRFATLLARLPPGCRVRRIVLSPPCLHSASEGRQGIPKTHQEEEPTR